MTGFCKLGYDQRKLRQYKRMVTVDAEQTPEMIEAQSSEVEKLKTVEEDSVPFGIRAIESGIEVDGVWISRSNTPVPSSKGSPEVDGTAGSRGSSFQPNHSRADSDIPVLKMPRPAYAAGPRLSNGAPEILDKASLSPEYKIRSRSSSLEPRADERQSWRNIPQVRQYSRSRSKNPSMLRHSSTLDALEGIDRDGLSGRIGFPKPLSWLNFV